MATADIVILVIVLLSALIGLVRGLLKEVLSLATWIAAVLAVVLFAPSAGQALAGQIEDPTLRRGVAMLVVFIAILIAGGLLQWTVGQLVRSTGLTGTDRLLGFLFGGGRGLVVCLVGLIAIRAFVETADWWQASALVPQLLAFEHDLIGLLGRSTEWFIKTGNGA
jgi:membrane protein required for colicin V production